MRKEIPVSLPVQFFPAGDRDQPPVAAMVTQVAFGGRCKLVFFFPQGGEVVTSREFVRHIDDPWVKLHPEQMRQSRHGVQCGAWDFVPGMVLKLKDTEPEAEEKPSPKKVDEATAEKRRANGEARVLELLAQSTPIDAICRSVRGFGFSKEDVEAVIESQKQSSLAAV